MSKIDKNSRVPLYAQLMDILIADMKKNLEEDEKLMSEREICEFYDVSRTTVRQALDQLEREGYIYKQHGRGTFVSSKKMNQDLTSFYSFTEEMKKMGKTPSSDIVGFELIESNSKIESVFRLETQAVFYKITRIRKADKTPMMYEITYLPFERFKGLSKEDLEKVAMYDVLEEKFDLDIDSASEEFQPISTSKLESIYLEINEGTPSLKIERFTHEHQKLIEYTVSVARGDKFKYKVNLKK